VIATCLFVYIIYDLFINGKQVGKNPWELPVFFTDTAITNNLKQQSETLEWTVDSPIPFHAYEEVPTQS
jgi:hypothetical protein